MSASMQGRQCTTAIYANGPPWFPSAATAANATATIAAGAADTGIGPETVWLALFG